MARARASAALVLLLAAGLAAELAAVAAPARAAVALPDTGLFAPVARQYARARERLSHVPAGRPERVELLLLGGQPAEAAREAAHLGGDPRALVVRARAALRVQDFATAGALVARLGSRGEPAARAVLYEWQFARDASEAVDGLIQPRLALGDSAAVPELLAAARLAYDRLDNAHAEAYATRALNQAGRDTTPSGPHARSEAHVRLALVEQRRREWDRSLAELASALGEDATPRALVALANTLVRLGRTDDAISCCEWGVRLDPYDGDAHYWLGNGYARKNYTELGAAYPQAFADGAGVAALAAADTALARGQRGAARAGYAALVRAHPAWVDARVRLASLDWEEARYAEARDGCFAALATCPEYGRAHAVLAKAIESLVFQVDVHRPDYERQFAAAALPDVPGIERFVTNWRSLTPRHQKRVALSLAPWRAFLPALIEGGATYYIKPLYMKLGDCPDAETLRDQRIEYDSRLWDDVRGAGGYHTVTGIEDVERTIFDRSNTVLHEFTHQVHGVLPAEDARAIQECYRAAKARDDSTHDGFMSRYSGESVYEYLAEGANALESPRRDAYDAREVRADRLDSYDPALKALLGRLMARTDVHASYPIAYAAGGDDRAGRGDVAAALPFYQKALAAAPDEETVLVAYANALVLGGQAALAESVAAHAVAAHPESGPAHTALADARWHAGRGLPAARAELLLARGAVRPDDRWQVDLALGGYAWTAGDAPAALAAYDSVLAYQADNPGGLRGRAAALALAGRSDEAFALYDRAVRARTGQADLRCEFARDLLAQGRVAEARKQLDEARLLDAENPTAEALRALADLSGTDVASAARHARQAVAWGPWCDLARIVEGAVDARQGDLAAAKLAWEPVRERMQQDMPPAYVFRPKIAQWERVRAMPAVERTMLQGFLRVHGLASVISSQR